MAIQPHGCFVSSVLSYIPLISLRQEALLVPPRPLQGCPILSCLDSSIEAGRKTPCDFSHAHFIGTLCLVMLYCAKQSKAFVMQMSAREKNNAWSCFFQRSLRLAGLIEPRCSLCPSTCRVPCEGQSCQCLMA